MPGGPSFRSYSPEECAGWSSSSLAASRTSRRTVASGGGKRCRRRGGRRGAQPSPRVALAWTAARTDTAGAAESLLLSGPRAPIFHSVVNRTLSRRSGEKWSRELTSGASRYFCSSSTKSGHLTLLIGSIHEDK